MQYVVRLSANDGVTDGFDANALCFQLSYTDLEIAVNLSFTGASSGMTRINQFATEFTCITAPVAVDGNTVSFSYGTGGTLPTIEFTRSNTNAPFYSELFTIVVDVYPTDLFELSCSFFRYADGDDVTCYYPNANTPPTPNFIVPPAYKLELDQDDKVLFLTNTPSFGAGDKDVTIPLRIRSNYTSPAVPLTVPYLDFLLTVESSAPIPPPVPQGATDYEVVVSPASGLNTFYFVKVRLTGSALTFGSTSGVLDMFSLKIDRPDPENMASTVEMNYVSGRFEGQFLSTPPGAVFCKTMTKGGSGDVTVNFTGDAECANSGLLLNVVGSAGTPPDGCGDLYATVSLGIPNNSSVRELRFVLDFDMTAGAFIDEANIINGLPCDLGDNLQSCIDRVGNSECYAVDGNSLTYCFKVSSGNEITYNTTQTMVIPVSAVSGCINKVTVREAAYYIVGQGTVTCVPNTNVTGFYVCSQEISGTVKAGSCWIEEVDVKIAATNNACNDYTEMTECFEPYSYCVCDTGIYTITPTKNDNPLNGVTTYDLVLISKHILGSEPLSNPYKIIAADANKSGGITTFDIVEFRKLILGTYDSLPNNTSWRFLPKDLEFVNPANPFQVAFKEAITAEIDGNGIEYSFTYNADTLNPDAADFVGIKVGDVNCTAVNCSPTCADCATYPQRPANPTERFTFGVPGMHSEPGETIVLPVYAGSAQPLVAYQAGLRFDPDRFEFLAVSAGDVPGFTPDCINLSEAAAGKVKVLWLSFDHESNYLQPDQVLFYLALRAKKAVRGNELILTTDDAVFANLGYTSEKLELPLQAALLPTNGQRAQPSGSGPLAISCSPNPTSGAIALSMVSEVPGLMQVAIFGPYGVRVYYREIEIGKGANNLSVPEAVVWPAGIYTWQVQVGAEKVTGRFVKL